MSSELKREYSVRRNFQARDITSVSEILQRMKQEGFTGTVSIHIGQGRINAASSEERYKETTKVSLTSD